MRTKWNSKWNVKNSISRLENVVQMMLQNNFLGKIPLPKKTIQTNIIKQKII